MLGEVTNCVPTLTPLVAKRYGTRPADVFFFRIGLRCDQDDSFLHQGLARMPCRGGNTISGDAAGAEAFRRGVRGRRDLSLHLHGWHLSRSSGGRGQHDLGRRVSSGRELDDTGVTCGRSRQGRGPSIENARPGGGSLHVSTSALLKKER